MSGDKPARVSKDGTQIKFNATKETMAYFKHMASWFYENKYIDEDSVDVLAKFALEKLASKFIDAEKQVMGGGQLPK